VLTLQTGFEAHCCFWLSANGSSIEKICPPPGPGHGEVPPRGESKSAAPQATG